MTTKLDDISEAIGQLRAEVRNLSTKLDQQDRSAADAIRRADQHRAAIHRRVDELVEEVGEVKITVNDLTNKLEGVEETVQDTKEVTDKVKMWEQRGIGALAFAGIAGTALGGTVVGFIAYWWDAIMRVLRAA